MNIANWKRTLALLTASIFLATGCASLQPVPLNGAAPPLQAGDAVVVTTRDGARHKFQVTSVEADALRGEHDRIAYADMKSLEVRRSDGTNISKTALIIGAVVLGAVAIGAASGGGGGGGY
jgi:hypothetical protein